ncbi:hypothetical protein UPYG_G00058170 [Umbra pygmaea]|uniref:Uncharacterized protein n=1 Tax=Umbra pygmaea TaxID=75934 RepID=A0ABD0XY71_UMBPY
MSSAHCPPAKEQVCCTEEQALWPNNVVKEEDEEITVKSGESEVVTVGQEQGAGSVKEEAVGVKVEVVNGARESVTLKREEEDEGNSEDLVNTKWSYVSDVSKRRRMAWISEDARIYSADIPSSLKVFQAFSFR